MVLIPRSTGGNRRWVTAVVGLAVLTGGALGGTGVRPVGAAAPAAPSTVADHRVDVVASFYPLAWLARAVGGDRVRVTDLTPPGAEPHDLELTTRDRDRIDRADVVLLLGRDFQPAVEAAAEQRDGPTVVVADAVDDGPAALRADPHLWLDPVTWGAAVTVVERALAAAAPADAADFAARADTVRGELTALDAGYAAGLADCRRHLVVSVHDAFARPAARYGLTTASLVGRSPEGEADARRLVDLADRVERAGVTTVFTEPLAPPDQARTLAREGGARVAVLDPVEGLTAAQRRRGDDYPTVMRRNLRALRRALGCT
jgi:zinc transport system substrate-binding protein